MALDVQGIVVQLDEEIQRLIEIRGLLSGTPAITSPVPTVGSLQQTSQVKRRGRPKGSVKATAVRKGGMTPEGRKRVADALRTRWATKRAEQAKKSVKK